MVQVGGPDFMMPVTGTPILKWILLLSHGSHNEEPAEEEVGTHFHKQEVQFICHFCISCKVWLVNQLSNFSDKAGTNTETFECSNPKN